MEINGTKIIVVKESVWQSWAKDIVIFGLLFLMFWLNHKFTDGSWAIDIVIGIMLFIGVASLQRRHEKMSLSEAEKYIKKLQTEAILKGEKIE